MEPTERAQPSCASQSAAIHASSDVAAMGPLVRAPLTCRRRYAGPQVLPTPPRARSKDLPRAPWMASKPPPLS